MESPKRLLAMVPSTPLFRRNVTRGPVAPAAVVGEPDGHLIGTWRRTA